MKALNVEPHLEDAAAHPVEAILVMRVHGVVGVVVGQRCHRHHFTGLGVQNNRAGGDCVKALHRAGQLIAHDVLHAKIDRKSDRFEVRFDRQPCRLEVGKTLVVDIFLKPGDPLVVDIDQAEKMRRGCASGIEPPLFAAKTDSGNAERVDPALLLRGQFAFEPDKSGTAPEFAVGIFEFERRKDFRQAFDCLVRVDDAARLRIQ